MKYRYRAIGAALAVLLSTSAAEAQTVDVIALGLNNPRGVALAPNGDLYVAVAGVGGAGPCQQGPTGLRCYGPSGEIIRIDLRRSGTATTVVSGLPSLAPPGGAAATGVHDIDFQGVGNLYFTIGFGGHPELRDGFGEPGQHMAHLARLLPNGAARLVSDIGTFEQENNPDQADTPPSNAPDSNPYGVLALPGRQIVADAGANALFEVRTNGRVRTLAVFPERLLVAPPVPMDAVPTGLALGPDGAYYVGQLTGGPFPVGGANVYRVNPDTGTVTTFASGFTNIIDVAFAPDGSLYVLQIAEPFGNWAGGKLWRVSPDGKTRELVNVSLTAPGALTVARDGTIYLTNMTIFPGLGQVLRIVP